MKKIIAIPQDVTAPGKDYLTERGYELVIGNGATDAESIKSLIANADGILARTALFPAEVLAAAPKLKVIGRHGIGVDNIDVKYCTEHGITVTFAPNSNAVSVAEHTIGMMIGAAHNFSRFNNGVCNGEWNIRNTYKGSDLDGKVLGLIGLGRIGTQVAIKCMAAFNMSVIAYDEYVPADRYPAGVKKVDSAEEVFKNADFVSLHCPATSCNRYMINKETLALMKKSAFLINCARGELVDEADLYDALQNGVIRGAAIDVFAQEPPQKDNILLGVPNILLTPHSAALTDESSDRMSLHAAMGIHSVLSGEKPEWPVN